MKVGAGLGCALVAALLGACGATPRSDDHTGATDASSTSVHHDCVRISRVRHFERLDDRNLLLFAPDRNNAYHVRLVMSCPDVTYGGLLSIEGGQGSLCGFAGENLRSGWRTGMPGDVRGERACPVRSVRRLDSSALQELLVEHGLGEQGEPAAGEVEQEIP